MGPIGCLETSLTTRLRSLTSKKNEEPISVATRGSAAAGILRFWVRIHTGTWMYVCCECCVLSGRGLCVGLITRPEESYWLWCVVVCDLETSWMRRPWPTGGLSRQKLQHSHDASRQRHMCVIPEAVIQFRCSWWCRSKHLQHPRNNKLSYTVASFWSFSYIITLRTGSFKLFKRPFPGFLTILTL